MTRLVWENENEKSKLSTHFNRKNWMNFWKHHINRRIHMATYSTIGSIILSFALTAFLYYFFWVAVLPFMRIEKGISPSARKWPDWDLTFWLNKLSDNTRKLLSSKHFKHQSHQSMMGLIKKHKVSVLLAVRRIQMITIF